MTEILEPLLENFLLALTETQLDRILVMISEGFNAIAEGVIAVWAIASPLLIGLVAMQLARYQAAERDTRKKLVSTIEAEGAKSQADRSKILEDLQANTKISSEAFVAANSHNEKIAAVVEFVKPKTPPQP